MRPAAKFMILMILKLEHWIFGWGENMCLSLPDFHRHLDDIYSEIIMPCCFERMEVTVYQPFFTAHCLVNQSRGGMSPRDI